MDSSNGEIPGIAVPGADEDGSASSTWIYMQQVLDGALDAVRGAREKHSELAAAIERYKTQKIELEDECTTLRARVHSAQDDAERTDDAIGMFRRENESLVKRYDKAVASLVAYNDAMKHARRLETRMKRIADAFRQLEKASAEIRAHYGPDADDHETLAEELNFARDVALEQIRRALDGVHIGTAANPSPEPAAH
jgi:chromosome segregation ATPase